MRFSKGKIQISLLIINKRKKNGINKITGFARVFFYVPVKGLGSFCLARGLTHPPTELIYIFPWKQRKNVVNVFNRVYYQR